MHSPTDDGRFPLFRFKAPHQPTGDDFDFVGSGFEVLFPPPDWPTADKPRNNDSMVLRVSFGESSVLLEGDAEKQVERRVAALHHPSASLLKVGTTGARTPPRRS